MACLHGHPKSIGFLLDHGAAVCVAGRNALADAARKMSILDIMVNQYSVDVNIADDSGRTALWDACFSPEPEYAVNALLKLGANLNLPSMGLLLPLVCNRSIPESVVKLLLSHGAVVDAIDSRGRTGLMHVCSRGCNNTAKLLLLYGADVNIADIDGNTALMRIVNARKYACLSLLLERGADVLSPFPRGRHISKTVLEVLRQGDSREAVIVREAAERQAQPVLK